MKKLFHRGKTFVSTFVQPSKSHKFDREQYHSRGIIYNPISIFDKFLSVAFLRIDKGTIRRYGNKGKDCTYPVHIYIYTRRNGRRVDSGTDLNIDDINSVWNVQVATPRVIKLINCSWDLWDREFGRNRDTPPVFHGNKFLAGDVHGRCRISLNIKSQYWRAAAFGLYSFFLGDCRAFCVWTAAANPSNRKNW